MAFFLTKPKGDLHGSKMLQTLCGNPALLRSCVRAAHRGGSLEEGSCLRRYPSISGHGVLVRARLYVQHIWPEVPPLSLMHDTARLARGHQWQRGGQAQSHVAVLCRWD